VEIILKSKKHLENGSIHAQMKVVSFMRDKYKHLLHTVEFKKTLTGFTKEAALNAPTFKKSLKFN
jgi:hypothetical protein